MSYCVSCDRTFRSKESLQQHQSTSSKHGGPFRCEACNRSFRSQQALGQHLGDSPVHQRLSKGALTALSTSALPSGHGTSQIPIKAGLESSNLSSRRAYHAPSDNTEDPPSTRDLPSMKLRDQSHHHNIAALETQEVRPKAAKAPDLKHEVARTFYVFPELHQSIAETVAPGITSIWFNSTIEDKGFNNEHATCTRGKFTCENKACKKRSWGSAVVTILIRGYAHNGYNVVVFNQRCKSCNELGILKLNEETYIERVAYRLKKWAGMMVAKPPFKGKTGPEHEQQFCEGCKKGICLRKINI